MIYEYKVGRESKELSRNDVVKLGLKILERLSKDNAVDNCVIAGGLVRGLLTSGEINDIDIYIERKSFATDKLCKRALASALGCEEGDMTPLTTSGEPAESYPTNTVYNIENISEVNYFGQKIQFIEIEFTDFSPAKSFGERVISGFPLGISQGYLTVNREVVTSEAMDKDIDNKTLTMLHENLTPTQAYSLLNSYLRKMVRQYPDYEIKVIVQEEGEAL